VRILTWSVLAALLTLGCTGATANVRAEQARYPLSFSGGVPEAGGKLLIAERDLEVVGHFDESYSEFTAVYGAVGDDGIVDISEDVNEAIAESGGEAVIRLRVDAAHCAFNYFGPLTWLPFWPGCTIVDVSGDIVRRRPLAARAAQ
jgi:hypothetical protein